jgi:signal recognition particle subunit SRP54
MGGLPGMGLPGMGLPGMGLPGMGPSMTADSGGRDSLTKMRPLSKSEKNAKKAQRKRERDARKKSRK